MAEGTDSHLCTIEHLAERYPDVAAQVEAHWRSLVDSNEYDYMDGQPRVALVNDWQAVTAYAWDAEHNCCGSVDEILEFVHHYDLTGTGTWASDPSTLKGSYIVKVMFGFNYGH